MPMFILFSIQSGIIEDFLRDMVRYGKAYATKSYTKIYLCVKGDLKDYIGKSHQEVLDKVNKIIEPRDEAAFRKNAAVMGILGGKKEEQTITDQAKLGKVEQKKIKHGRDAATWCLAAYSKKLNVGDIVSVVRNRDARGIVNAKVSYVGKVLTDKNGTKIIKKIAS